MITVVLDATTSLGDSEVYKPLLYRSMRNETCFYIENEEVSKVNKIKSIIKYYPKNDYELIILLDLMKIGESLIEKVYQINKTILAEVFSEVKVASKIRYVVLDYINSKYLPEEKAFLKNIENIQTEQEITDYLNQINGADGSITWTEQMANVEFFNVKDLFIERILPRTEIDIITLNKMPSEEKEEFFRNIYLKVYGFINLIADGIIEEDLTLCCYQEIPIYNMTIALNEEVIEECAKRFLVNLENENKKLDLHSFDKIEYTNLFDDNEKEENKTKKVISEMKKAKLQLKVPKIAFINKKKDVRKLEIFIQKAKDEYKYNSDLIKKLHSQECQEVRNALNKKSNYVRSEFKERFEIENKIKEEQEKIEKLKYKKAKLIVENKKENEDYSEYIDEQKILVEDSIDKHTIFLKSFIYQVVFLVLYMFAIFILIKPDYTLPNEAKTNIYRTFAIICSLNLLIFIVISSLYRYAIKKEYKNIIKELERLFFHITENQRESVENIQLAKQLIKSQKTIKHLQTLLENANEQNNNVSLQKANIRNYKNFCELVVPNIMLDGSINVNDLDSSYGINISERVSYKNKAYSFLDYIVFNKYSISFKNANTSRIVKKENAGTYISYVSIE